MKKKLIYLIPLLLLAVVIIFVACSLNLNEKIWQKISEESRELYSGEGSNFYLTLTVGEREEPYERDGFSNNKVIFSVICVTFFENKTEENFNFTININDQTFSGTLEKNVFRGNYMTDLQIPIESGSEIILTLNEETINLTCISDEFATNYEKAINLAIENLVDEIEKMSVSGQFQGECFLKILNNPLQNKGIFFWHFSIVGQNGDQDYIVIDTMTNAILAKG